MFERLQLSKLHRVKVFVKDYESLVLPQQAGGSPSGDLSKEIR
jgi:hypothetical protein